MEKVRQKKPPAPTCISISKYDVFCPRLFHFSLLPNAKAQGKLIQTMKPCASKLDSKSWQSTRRPLLFINLFLILQMLCRCFTYLMFLGDDVKEQQWYLTCAEFFFSYHLLVANKNAAAFKRLSVLVYFQMYLYLKFSCAPFAIVILRSVSFDGSFCDCVGQNLYRSK